MTKRIVKVCAICLCATLLVAILCATTGIILFKHSKNYVRLDCKKLNEVYSNLTIIDCNGNKIKDTFYFGDNRLIPLATLHDYTYMAFVAVEDKRFFEHDGFDLKRIVGAAARNIKSGSFKEGASTITQQLIKNTHLSREKNLKRKINEMLLATELENKYSKREILEMYLNTIYFGRNAYGIENAANVYFNKSASDLSLSESATLAGMIKAPNIYAPDKNIEKCQVRRNIVLKLMFEQNLISEDSYQTAVTEEIVYRQHVESCVKTYAEMAIDEACRIMNLSREELFRSEYVIETYFDSQIQNNLNECVNNDKTQNIDGSLANLSCIICNNDGGVAASYFRGESSTLPKQIGSTAKPIAVYAPAFCEKIITQASPVLDEETNFSGYKPTNNGKYYGWTTVKNAVAKSLNIPAVKTLNSLGIAKAEKYLAKMGISGKQNLSLALGNVDGGMTPLQLTNCYLVLANGGKTNNTHFVKTILKNNKIVYSHKATTSRVFDEKSTYLMTDLLQNAVKNGTGKKLRANYQIAAKTGTVGTRNGNSQALVAGYTTEHTFVFWFSGDMDNTVSGSNSPCVLASNVLNKIYSNNQPEDFVAPKGVEKMCIDDTELNNNQLVVASTEGEEFVFDCENAPKFIAQEKFDYKLSTTNNGKIVRLILPNVQNGTWKIFKKENGTTYEVSIDEVANGSYYAQLWMNNRCIYTTPTIQVTNNAFSSQSNTKFRLLPT